MASSAIQNLRAAVEASVAAQAPFALDAAYLTAGMADPAVRVPDRYDGDLAKAFQVAAAADFKVSAAPGSVGPVADDRFSVGRASLPFIGVKLDGTGTVTFSLSSDGATLVVAIESRPAPWTWTTSFPAMTSWPFTALAVSEATFGFLSTSGPQQSAAVACGVPPSAIPLLSLFDPPVTPPPVVTLRGVLDLSSYDGKTVLFPRAALRGLLYDGSVSLIYLRVGKPAIALNIPAPANPQGKRITDTQQTPQLSISAELELDEATSTFVLELALPQRAGTGVPFNISLRANEGGSRLTPSSMLALAGGPQSGGRSYLGAVPPVLQQFMTSVSLRGLVLAGTVGKPPKLSRIGLEIGSVPGMAWTPLPDAPPGLDFTFRSFALAWSLIDPFNAASRQQAFQFSTAFTLAPAVFKGRTPGSDGVFTVRFGSDLQFAAGFDGTASLRDFVDTLSGGAITLPDGVEASVSDIAATVDYPERSFTFGSAFDAEVSFLEVGGKPVLAISNGAIALAAMTPTQDDKRDAGSGTPAEGRGRTRWQAGIGGLLAVGPVSANVGVAYDGFADPAVWSLEASLAQPIDVGTVVQQFFDPGGSYDFPAFLPGTLLLKTFDIAAKLGGKGGKPPTTYRIDTTFSWLLDLGDQEIGIDPARLIIAYDGGRPAKQQFSGLAEGTWVYSAINLELKLGYTFQPTAEGPNRTLYLEWEGFRASYESGKEQISFALKGWSVGTLIQALVRTLGDPYFVLPSPWDLLDEISLDGLSLIVSLKSGVKNRLSASYTLSKPLNLGFVTIDGLVFRRDTDGKVTLAIDGTVPAPLQGTMGDLLNPAKGQDVQNMPAVPGGGSAYFKLHLLALGQRVGITGYSTFTNTESAVQALKQVPNTTGQQNPVNPTADKGTTKGLPYYEPANHWLIAGHMGLLKAAGVWMIDVKVVFNDPNLYGLRLALDGGRAGGLKGLVIDILYKKITDDIGCFQLEFTFPDAIRNLNFGAVSVVLPQIGVQIYTNGDFLIDIGFPYKLDFRRSFSISAIIYGVPVLGAGGLYFGKLSGATATQVPRTQRGTFNPVIVFGLGLQLGLGYNFVKGPLQAGFALTVFGVIEGVIAAWHPYEPASGRELVGAELGSLQDEYYFKISGTVGIIGLLYGKVDFAIIQASVNVNITLSLQITYESYRAIPLVAAAKVDVSLKVKINLGLFSISISLSFAMTVSATFVIGSDGIAPWDTPEPTALRHARRRQLLTEGPAAIQARARRLQSRPRRLPAHVAAAADKPQLRLITAPQYTVLAPPGATDPSAQQGAFVFLFAMDAPALEGTASGRTSFDILCQAYFPWLAEALGGDPTALSRVELETFVARLADLETPALSTTHLLGFLADHFILDISTTQASTQDTRDAMAAGAMLFPVFDGLSLSVPDPNGTSGTRSITFETYATATPDYRAKVSKTFAEVAVRIGEEADAPRGRAVDGAPESLASLVFGDALSIVGRQLLQAALDALDAYAYKLSNSAASPDSIGWIVGWAAQRGNMLLPDDVALPNQDHALTVATRLALAGLSSTLQADDTLRSVAARFSDPGHPARWSTSASSLVTGNGDARVLRPGVTLTLTGAGGAGSTYVTTPGDSFATIAGALGITLEALSVQPAVLDAAGLLLPATALTIPSFVYSCAGGDTLRSVAARFATTVPALATANLDVAGLFALDADGGALSLANLTTLPAADLWSAIQATDQVAMTAGMVSRFLMFGLRLPRDTGLELSPQQFLYPMQQTSYGLYQLTGQQFPVPAALGGNAEYAIEVARADISHGVSLDFVRFDGAAGKQARVDLTSAWSLLNVVVTWAKTGAFQPAPSFHVLPLAEAAPRAIALGTPALWSTSDRAALGRITDRGRGVGNPLAQPTWWPLPGGFADEIAARQSALTPLFPDFGELIPRMPRYAPMRVVASANHADTTATPLNNYAWGTRVDVNIKRMPALPAGDARPQGEGSVPAGPAVAASLPYVYELVAPASETGTQLAGLVRAMAALGPSLTSSVSLLYGQATGAAAGSGDAVELVSRGEAEFLSFVVRTNLSTDANPAGDRALPLGDVEAPHGIANTPADMVRLLWELSVVRNGGYFLYYRVLDGDAGLPASLFNADGSATLSFVFTLAATGVASIGDSPLDFVNGFVSVDDLDRRRDTVELVAQAGSTTSKALDGQASLAALAATYGTSPGRLATANPAAVISAGTRLTIAGIDRQLGPADVVDPATALAKLAAYYSQGVAEPITAADIAALNPGVAVAPGAVFFIPSVVYGVAAAAAPGQTLGSVALYYGLSLDALAVLAADVPRLLVVDTVLELDTQALEPRTTIGTANLGIALGRANLGQPTLPANPTPGEEAAFARTSMYALYNTLSAGFAANRYFDASPFGLPFGPQSDAAGPAPAHPLRAAAQRRDRLAAALDDDYRYRQILGLGTFAKVNPAIGSPHAPAAGNPYIGVGTPAQIALRWQDLFGNTTVTPFTAVPPGYTGAISGAAIPVRYRDTLVNPSGWPQALLYFSYSSSPAGATLDIELQLSTKRYEGQQDQACRDLTLYKLVYYQLHQNYTGQNVPNVTGNAVGMQVTDTLLAEPVRRLTDGESGTVRGFVSDCVAYLTAVVDGTALPPPPKAKLGLPVDPSDLAAGDLIEIGVTLSLARQVRLVDPDIAALPGGLRVDCPVLPKPDDGKTIAYTEFSRGLEAVFRQDTWHVRVGEGLRDRTDDGGGSRQLMAVRFGAGGIAFRIGDAASYYAPQPTARSLIDRSATFKRYPSGESVTSAFTAVDQNLWFQAVLDAVDTFLSGPTSTSVYALERMLGTSDPLTEGYLGKVLDAKRSLAGSISATMAPILSTSEDDLSSVWAAETTLREQLLARLGPAYAAGAVLVFGLDGVTGGSGPLPARLYGQPRGTLATASDNANYTLSPARLPLGPTTVDGNTHAPRLALALTTQNVKGQAYIPLDLRYEVSHIEFDRSPVPGIDGYLESRWLALVSGPIDLALGAGPCDVPVVNRALPVPPTMTLQTGEKLHARPASADQLPLWTYRFAYAGGQAAQDLVDVTIDLNAPPQGLSAARTDLPDLFTALARFVSNYPAILADLTASLPAVGAGQADEATIELARRAVEAFQEHVGAVAATHAESPTETRHRRLTEAPGQVEITMKSRLDGMEGVAVSEILDLRINEIAATWDATTGTISNGTVELPAPWVEIAPERYEAEPVSLQIPGVVIAYRYRSHDGEYLSFEAAQAIPSRSVVMKGLNVLLHQSAWSSLKVERNRILTPIADAGRVETRKDFVFQTPTVRFADPLIPRLVYPEFQLEGPEAPLPGIGDALALFYASLFTDGDGSISTNVTMTSAYSYKMKAEAPRTILPISMVPSMETLVVPTPTPAFVPALAQLIENWFIFENPTRQIDAQIDLSLTVFSKAGARQPLLVVDNLKRSIPP